MPQLGVKGKAETIARVCEELEYESETGPRKELEFSLRDADAIREVLKLGRDRKKCPSISVPLYSSLLLVPPFG